MSGDARQSWKPSRRAGFEPWVRRVAVIGAGVLGAAGLGYGGYSLMGHAPRVVPVIEADSRPLRVRPDDRGGMQVAGADEPMMGGPGGGGVETMAPPPEAPQLGALRAQIQAARQPASANAPAVSLPAPPPPSPAVVEAPPVRAPVRATPAVGGARPGGVAVQLSSMATEQLAMAEWARLAKRMPELLGARRADVQRADRDGQAIWRLRTGGFADAAGAAAFCTQVKAKGAGCSVASF